MEPMQKQGANLNFIKTVRRLGYVPFCVRDAFSWLPHAMRTKGGREILTPQAPDSERCSVCLFQEPRWSQGYAGCSMSWLHDRDNDCRVFYDRAAFREKYGTALDDCCVPPRVAEATEEDAKPYWSDGTRYAEIEPSLNFPSEYCARLNMERWYYEGGGAQLYERAQDERLRRFNEWVGEDLENESG